MRSLSFFVSLIRFAHPLTERRDAHRDCKQGGVGIETNKDFSDALLTLSCALQDDLEVSVLSSREDTWESVFRPQGHLGIIFSMVKSLWNQLSTSKDAWESLLNQ